MPSFVLSKIQRPLRLLSMRRKKTAQASSNDDDAGQEEAVDQSERSAETGQPARFSRAESAPLFSQVSRWARDLMDKDAPLDSWHLVHPLALDATQVADFGAAARRVNQSAGTGNIEEADKKVLEPLAGDVTALLEDANQFFSAIEEQDLVKPNQLHREARQQFGGKATPGTERSGELFKLAFPGKNTTGAGAFGAGLAIGEDHTLPDARRYLMTHMQQFKKMGVKTLYTEVIKADTESAALSEFNRSGKFTDDLRQILNALDCPGLDTDDINAPSLVNLFTQAYANGIKIKSCDNFSSACGIPLGLAELMDFSALDRASTMNYVGFELIRRRQKAMGGTPFLIHAGANHFRKIGDAYGINTLLGIPAIQPTQEGGFEVLN